MRNLKNCKHNIGIRRQNCYYWSMFKFYKLCRLLVLVRLFYHYQLEKHALYHYGKKVLHKIIINIYNKYKKQNEKDQQTTKSLDKLYRKSIQDNVIGKNE